MGKQLLKNKGMIIMIIVAFIYTLGVQPAGKLESVVPFEGEQITQLKDPNLAGESDFIFMTYEQWCTTDASYCQDTWWCDIPGQPQTYACANDLEYCRRWCCFRGDPEGCDDPCTSHTYWVRDGESNVRYYECGVYTDDILDCAEVNPGFLLPNNDFNYEVYETTQDTGTLALELCGATNCECTSGASGDTQCCDGCNYRDYGEGRGDICGPGECLSSLCTAWCFTLNTECTKYSDFLDDEKCDGTKSSCPTDNCVGTHEQSGTACGNNGQCDGLGTCVEIQPLCTTGACCDGSKYRTTSFQCGQFDCSFLDTSCRTYHQEPIFCDGGSETCPPNTVCTTFSDLADGTVCDTGKECNGRGTCLSVDCDLLKGEALHKITLWAVDSSDSTKKQEALGAISLWASKC